MKWFITAAVVVVCLWAVSWGLIWAFEEDPTVRGQFGDMFGAVNALFSGLAFAGVVVVIFLQRRDLEVQQKMLSLQMEELRASREAQESQVKALTITAKINARSALLANRNVQFQSSAYYEDNPEAAQDWQTGQMKILNQLLKELDDSS